MADFTVSLPEELRSWVQSQVADGSHATTSDYLSTLIRRDIDQDEGVIRLRAAIDEGRASGISKRSLADIIRDHVSAQDAA